MKKNSLGKEEILRGRKFIKWAFDNSETVYSDDFAVIRLCIYGEKRVLFAVERKVRKAVQRNRIKRILREFYRRNKQKFPEGIWIFIGKKPLYSLKSYEFKVDFCKIRERYLHLLHT